MWRGGSLAWIAPSLAVPSRDPALKLHCCLIWVSGNECCTVSCYGEREKHTRTYTRSGNMSELGLLRSSSPSMTYFETVIICRGMPSGLDQRDPISLCFRLEEALTKLLIFPFCAGSLFFWVFFFFLLALRLETSRGVFDKYNSLGLCFSIMGLC